MSERISHDPELVETAREHLIELNEQRGHQAPGSPGHAALDIREKILNAVVDGTSRDELVADLSSITYSFPRYKTQASESRVPGTWNEVVTALVEGYLTDDEFRAVAKVAGPNAHV